MTEAVRVFIISIRFSLCFFSSSLSPNRSKIAVKTCNAVLIIPMMTDSFSTADIDAAAVELNLLIPVIEDVTTVVIWLASPRIDPAIPPMTPPRLSISPANSLTLSIFFSRTSSYSFWVLLYFFWAVFFFFFASSNVSSWASIFNVSLLISQTRTFSPLATFV